VFSESQFPVHTYCLAADSVTGSGADSVYYFYTHIGESVIESDSCSFWGSNQCNLQDQPVWSGLTAMGRQGGACHFLNVAGDSLHFNFDMHPGDTTLLMATNNERFLLTCEGFSLATILETTDSVKNFRIVHTDLLGLVIASAIHQQPITLGKTLGLIDFIRIDSFPLVLMPLTLVGQTSPSLGLNKITEGMIFDHLPGDVIQRRYQRFANPGPPWENYVRYTKHTFLNRIEQPGLLTYSVAAETFYMDSLEVHYDTITLNYFPDRVAIAAPFDRHNPESLVYNSVYYDDFDGFPYLTYHTKPGYLAYCAPDNCWGSTDTFGPPPDEWVTYACGLGIWNQHYFKWDPGVSSLGFDEQLVYFKRGGLAIGNEFFVGLANPITREKTMKITPNPATDVVMVSFVHQVDNGQLVVSDMNGRVLITQIINGSQATVNISSLAVGMYLMKVSGAEGIQTAVVIKK